MSDTQTRTDRHLARLPTSAIEPARLQQHGTISAVLGTAAALAIAAPPVLVGVMGDYEPLTRIGQVSAVAAVVCTAFVSALIVMAVAYLLVPRWPTVSEEMTGTLLASTGSGVLAGITAAALSGTTFGLNGVLSDAGNLIRWSTSLTELEPYSNTYPPGFPIALAAWAAIRGVSTAMAMPELQILGSAVVGPLAYGLWRMTRPPLQAGALAGISALTAVSPYKPYEGLALALLLPLLVWIMKDLLGICDARPTWESLVLRGSGLGILCTTYSGWFYWSMLAIPVWLAAFSWRHHSRGLLRAGAYLTAGFAIGLVPTFWLWYSQGAWTGGIRFRLYSESIYYGAAGLLDASDVLFGLGALLLVAVVGSGVAVAFSPRSFALALAPLVVSALLLRFWLAYRMGITGDVQLWYRTGRFLATTLLVMATAGAIDAACRVKLKGHVSTRSRLLAAGSGGVLLFIVATGHAADSFMPNTEGTGLYALRAHLCPTADPPCPDGWELPTGTEAFTAP